MAASKVSVDYCLDGSRKDSDGGTDVSKTACEAAAFKRLLHQKD